MSTEDLNSYPPDWKAISLRVRSRDGWACKCAGHCGRHLLCDSTTRLTAAHLNHWPGDCRDENLLTLCWQCHLRYDVITGADHPGKQARRKATVARNKAKRETEYQASLEYAAAERKREDHARKQEHARQIQAVQAARKREFEELKRRVQAADYAGLPQWLRLKYGVKLVNHRGY